MSKNILNYKETKPFKSSVKKSKKPLIILVFVLILVGVVLIINSMFGFVKITEIFDIGTNFIKIKGHKYYAVTMGEYDTVSEAESVASGTSVAGAGSYVWYNTNKYYVIGNVYSSLSDANSVVENISNTNYNIAIKEIEYKTINYKADNYTSDQRKFLKNAISSIDDLFKKCYDYAIRFDKGEVVATVVSSELNTIKSDLMVTNTKLDAVNTTAVSNQTLHIKNAYVSLINELDNSILKVINGSSGNKDLKYLVSSVAIIKYDLYQNLNK